MKKVRSKRAWKKQVEEENVKIDLRREDELSRLRWSVGINRIAAGLRLTWPHSIVGHTIRF